MHMEEDGWADFWGHIEEGWREHVSAPCYLSAAH